MIYHLINAGVPVSWSIIAIYPSAYGIAQKSAEAWQSVQKESLQMIVEIKDDEILRSKIFWNDHGYKQQSENRQIHIQGCHAGELSISDKTRNLIAQTVHAALVEKEFLIENDEWDRRYPATKLINERFAEYFQAKKEKGAELPYEDKWAIMMEAPQGYEVSYNVRSLQDGYAIVPNRKDAGAAPEKIWKEITDAESVCRMMNSGWTYEEALILITPEPVGAQN